MSTIKHSMLALALLGSAFLAGPSFAVEPDVDSPAGPELPAPRYDRPDFQFDDQAGAPLERDIEGTDRLGAGPVVVVPDEDDVEIIDDDDVETMPPPVVPEP
jgi:hypothetical protein